MPPVNVPTTIEPSRPEPSLEMQAAAFRHFCDLWRGEDSWPRCNAPVALVLYDVCRLLGMNEAGVMKYLGPYAVAYITKTLNTPVSPP